VTIFGLTIAGAISAKTAGTDLVKATTRVVIGGMLGMVITGAIGAFAHTVGL
jgi:VIT1/CCC1 family predicted Fe2+/Mn2+ transporter